MKVRYAKQYRPFVDSDKFKFTLGNTYDVIEYNISTQKMLMIKDDNNNSIKYSDKSKMVQCFEIVES